MRQGGTGDAQAKAASSPPHTVSMGSIHVPVSGIALWDPKTHEERESLVGISGSGRGGHHFCRRNSKAQGDGSIGILEGPAESPRLLPSSGSPGGPPRLCPCHLCEADSAPGPGVVM